MADTLETVVDEDLSDAETADRNDDPLQHIAPYSSPEELLELCQDRHQVDLNAEDMDPLEWTFRTVVPIPKYYYWDIIRNEEDVELIPTKTKLWHQSIHALSVMNSWTEQRISRPIADSLGLNNPWHNEVAMYMTDEDWEKSRQAILARSLREQKRQEDEKHPLAEP